MNPMKYLLFLSIFLLGCTQENNYPNDIEKPISNNSGQNIIFVDSYRIKKWFIENPKNKIVTITSYTSGDSGTQGYMVVYTVIPE